MVKILKQVSEIKNTELGDDICPDRSAHDHRIHHAELDLVDDIGLLAKLVVREELRRQLAIRCGFQPGYEKIVPDARRRKLRVIRIRPSKCAATWRFGPFRSRRARRQANQHQQAAHGGTDELMALFPSLIVFDARPTL
jgi:hypothetical protein